MTEAQLYLLLAEPIAGAVPEPLPPHLAVQTIERSLWSAEEKSLLKRHKAHTLWTFSLNTDPVRAFIEAYKYLQDLPHLVGVANPIACTAHHARWIRKIFADGLEAVALRTPPLHLWTGLVLVEMELSLSSLLEGKTAALWLRTAGYEQFGLPNLAHPLQDPREIGWIHSLFEVLFDWMYFEGRALQVGDRLEVPERGRYEVGTFLPGVLALIEWAETRADTFS
ncbi:MAG: hypothetical protein NZ958_03045 [Bacteroidia bacterium]|nr:hypothetical protein [Bacteroidia bacterium]MDW8089604.1 hypothetical protein [Bacteroidia bacterium]